MDKDFDIDESNDERDSDPPAGETLLRSLIRAGCISQFTSLPPTGYFASIAVDTPPVERAERHAESRRK